MKQIKDLRIKELGKIKVFRKKQYWNDPALTIKQKAEELKISETSLKEIEAFNKKIQTTWFNKDYSLNDNNQVVKRNVLKTTVPSGGNKEDVVKKLEATIDVIKTWPTGTIKRSSSWDFNYHTVNYVVDETLTEKYKTHTAEREELLKKVRAERLENLKKEKAEQKAKELAKAKAELRKLELANKKTEKEKAEIDLIKALTEKINKGVTITDAEGKILAKVLST